MSNTIKVNKSFSRNADSIKVSTLHTRAAITKSSVNLEARTVDVVFGTDTPVQMYDWELGRYMEILSFDPAHIHLERANAGAPVLNMHDRYEQIGVIENARVENGKGVATLRFSKNKDAEEVWNDVVDGIKTKVSVGYDVFEYQEITLPGETIRTLKAIDWSPSEISMVSKPADINSGVRTENSVSKNVKISQLNRSNEMPTKEELEAQQAAEAAKPATVPAEPAADPAKPEATASAPASEDATRAAQATERTRSTAIMQMGRMAGMPMTEIEKIVASDVTVDKARESIMAHFEKGDPASGSSNVRLGKEDIEKRREAMTAGIVLRAMGSRATSDKVLTASEVEAGREFRGDSLVDLARMSLDRIGVNHRGMDKMELVRSAITSSGSDFPVLLSGLNRRVLLASYEATADVWRRFCAVGSVSDFRNWDRLRMGSISDLDKVGENGEFKTKKITDANYETIKAGTKGNLINVSRQMIVNDDLNGITNYAQQLGRAAARSIENDVFALLALNAGLGPLMVDGQTLFHATHGNIATTPATPDFTAIGKVKAQMKKIKDKDSNDFLNITPALWLGPVDLEDTVNVANDSQYTNEANKFQVPNTSRGTYKEIIGTPRLTGTHWYSFADPNVEPVIEVAFLDGNETPFLDSQEGFNQDGMTWKIRHDYGVGAVGYRGAVRNAGA